MPSQATLLYRLQSVDLELARRRARLKEIDSLLNNDATVAQATEQLASAEQVLKPWTTRARDLDLEIKSVADKLKSTDDDLYSGRIRSPKALQELQEEIEALKRQQSQLEDGMLEAMMEVETHQTEVTTARQTLTEARANLATKLADLLDEQKRLQTEVVKVEEQRKQMAVDIDSAALATYDRLRQRFRGQAIALLVGEGCSVCGVDQTSVGVQKIRSGRTVVTCESCGRILAEIS